MIRRDYHWYCIVNGVEKFANEGDIQNDLDFDLS